LEYEAEILERTDTGELGTLRVVERRSA
jgi:hypothetical protein